VRLKQRPQYHRPANEIETIDRALRIRAEDVHVSAQPAGEVRPLCFLESAEQCMTIRRRKIFAHLLARKLRKRGAQSAGKDENRLSNRMDRITIAERTVLHGCKEITQPSQLPVEAAVEFVEEH